MRYAPEPLGRAAEDVTPSYLSEYLQRALANISGALDQNADGVMEVFTFAPARAREGLLRYADGTAWNPANGKGLHIYDGTSWYSLFKGKAGFYTDETVVGSPRIYFDSGDYLAYNRTSDRFDFFGGGTTLALLQAATFRIYSTTTVLEAILAYQQIASILATGTAPISVTSTTMCSNLTAQYLGAVSQDAAFFRNASNINAGTIGNSYVNWASPSAIGTGTPQDGTFKSVIISGSGTYGAGSIYADTNWGMIFRAKNASPSQAEFLWTNSAGTDLARITGGGALGITDGITAPGTVASVAHIYVDSADGDLKVKFGDGTVKTLATDT